VTYVVRGPEALSYGDAAQTIGDAIGEGVVYEAAEPRPSATTSPPSAACPGGAPTNLLS